MSRSVHKVSTVARIVFPIFNAANALVTGRAASVTKNLLKDGAADATAVTVTEDGTSGIYSATFTPASTGHWFLLVRDSTNAPRGYDHEWDVTTYGTDLAAGAAAGVLTTPAQKLFTDVSGSVSALLGPNVVTAAVLADDAITEIQAGLATSASIAALSIPTAAANAAAVGALAKDGFTLLEHVGVQSAMLAGKVTGGPGSAGGLTFRSVNDSADRVVMTATSNGDRTSVAITA